MLQKSKQETGRLKTGERTVRYLVLLAILAVVCVMLSIVTDTFLSLSTITNIIGQISVQSIVAVGMTMVIITGGIDLSVGTSLMLCGVISATVMTATGSVFLGMAACIITAMVVGFFNGFMVGYSKIVPFMATLAMQSVCKGLGWTISGANRIMVREYKAFTWLGQESIKLGKHFSLPVAFFAIVAVYLFAIFMMNKTVFGTKIYAIGGNAAAARASGIDVKKNLLLTYISAGICVGIASIISVGRTVSSQPQAGTGMEFDAITAVVIGGTALEGGMGGLFGTLLGAVLVGVISFGLGQLSISPYVQYVVKGMIILAAIAADADGYIMCTLRDKIARKKDTSVKAEEQISHGKSAAEFDRTGNHRKLRMEGIQKSFSGVQVLKDVNFAFERGKVHALCGENGAGKSTLMKILAGSYGKDQGSIYIDDVPYEIHNVRDAQKIGISVIYQELSLIPELTVAQNIFLGKEMLTNNKLLTDRKKMNALAEEYLQKLGLSIDVTSKAGTLTVGQQQMVEIAKAYASESWVIVMDEPTSAITEKDKESLFRIIEELKQQNVAIIYISHRMPEIFQIADELTVLRDGAHVVTTSMDGVKESDIVKWMVGRELSDVFKHSERTCGEVVLEVKHLTKKGVFQDISFQVRAGEVLGVSGLIGAGRTEVMRCVFGLDSYDAGEVYFLGKLVHFRRPKEAIQAGIGFVPEDRRRESIIPRMSVLSNMSLASLPWIHRLGVIDREQVRTIFSQYIERFAIKMSSSAQHITYLSGGNQQKAILGKWLARNPKLLILDEPTRGIDVGAKADIYQLIDELAKDGRAVIMISSEMPEILGISDSIMVLYEGRQTGLLQNERTVTQEQIMTYATGSI